MREVRFSTLALAIVVLPSIVWGQNLLSNSTFDTDVTGWTTNPAATIEWSPLDAVGSPTSGSALVTNLSTVPGDASGAYQCVDGLTGDGFFRIAADVLIPGGHTETGNAHLLVQWFDTAGCTGVQLGLVTSTGVSTATPDVWSTISDMVASPTGTLSARFRLSVRKNVDFGSLEAHFDNVEFEPWIFVDGFESGDTSAWSGTVP